MQTNPHVHICYVGPESLQDLLSWLEISIYGCRIWLSAGKIGQKSSNFNSQVQDLAISRKYQTKSLNEVLGLKIDGCMHPLPQIDGCSCTLRTRTNQGPVQYFKGKIFALSAWRVGLHLKIVFCVETVNSTI